MRILIVGNGGREHTLLWKLRRDAPEARFYATRPSGGMTELAQPVDLPPTDVDSIADWAAAQKIGLVVIGPEAPLAAGLADRLQARSVPAFGPSAAAARLESSKAFAKALMERAGVPTAGYRTFTDARAAAEYVRRKGGPLVVKASGLAAGKGAVVCAGTDEALAAVQSMMTEGSLGNAGREVVIEDFMEGEELSVFAITDGSEVITLLASQDHKRIGEGDTGPNTGGMGAYAPVSVATTELLDEVEGTILRPTLEAMSGEGAPFRGLLYAGLMLTSDGPRVVEFNCRFGDPETQVVLPLMESSLLEPVRAVAEGGTLGGYRPAWRAGAAVTTVLASGGYPGRYRKGLPIEIPEEVAGDPDLLIFHAGTEWDEGRLRTAGGRVLAVTGIGSDLREAAGRSRRAAAAIQFEGKTFRGDIGWRELARDEGTRP